MESKKIDLTNGNWVVLKDPNSLKVKDRKKIFKNMQGQEGLMQAISLMDGIVSVIIEEWSFELPIPAIKISSIDELSINDYHIIQKEMEKIQQVLFPAITETPESQADDNSPFDKSNA